MKCLSGNDGPEHEPLQFVDGSEIITNNGDIAETLNCFFVDQQKNLSPQIGLNNVPSTGARPPPPPLLSLAPGNI